VRLGSERSADKAGAQTRLGETKKSVSPAKAGKSTLRDMFYLRFDVAVEKQLKTERGLIRCSSAQYFRRG